VTTEALGQHATTPRRLLAAYAVVAVLNVVGELLDSSVLANVTKPFLMPLLLAFLLLVVLGPDLGGLLVPVAVYGAVLCTMAALATGVHRWTMVGALLFLCSDSALAATSLSDRVTIPAADAVVMVTYTLGQALIVLGVLAASKRVEPWCPRPESNWRPFA
jgi:uncharacterized membrane protein YhhN